MKCQSRSVMSFFMLARLNIFLSVSYFLYELVTELTEMK